MSARRPEIRVPDLLGLGNRFMLPRAVPGRRDAVLRVLDTLGLSLPEDGAAFERYPTRPLDRLLRLHREALEALSVEGLVPESWADGGLCLNPGAYTAERMDFFYNVPVSTAHLARLAELAPAIPTALALAREAGQRIAAILHAPEVAEDARGNRGRFLPSWAASLDVVTPIGTYDSIPSDVARKAFLSLEEVIMGRTVTPAEAVKFWRRYVKIDRATLEAMRDRVNLDMLDDRQFEMFRRDPARLFMNSMTSWTNVVGDASRGWPSAGFWYNCGWALRVAFIWDLMACSPRKKLRPRYWLAPVFDLGERTFASTPNPFAPLASLIEMGFAWTCRIVPDGNGSRPAVVVGIPLEAP